MTEQIQQPGIQNTNVQTLQEQEQELENVPVEKILNRYFLLNKESHEVLSSSLNKRKITEHLEILFPNILLSDKDSVDIYNLLNDLIFTQDLNLKKEKADKIALVLSLKNQ